MTTTTVKRRRRRDPCIEFADELAPPVDGAPSAVLVAGLDEAGRGPLAGPVVAACVVLHPDRKIRGLDDSKKLDADARAALYDKITAGALAWGIGTVEVARIDEINILRASLEAMAHAFTACCARAGRDIQGAILDGNQRAPLPRTVQQRTLVGGDAKSRPIMAASILAKVARDRRMIEEAARFPAYGFEKHKGYSTKAHFEALIAHGPTPLHRRSFAPVRLAQQGALSLGHYEALFVEGDAE